MNFPAYGFDDFIFRDGGSLNVDAAVVIAGQYQMAVIFAKIMPGGKFGERV